MPPPKEDHDPHPETAAEHESTLKRFSAEAISFLSRAYPSSEQDHLIERDRLRLQRFHQQAVSFLERAYADDSSTLVEEKALSPRSSQYIVDVELLQNFHNEAMSITNVAPQDGIVRPNSSPDSNLSRQQANTTAIQIARDKARLEQHYQDAMSFLNRAEKGSGLVEEQELEGAALDKMQLQRYAKEAIVFLEKAFREDASIMIEDGDISPRSHQATSDNKPFGDNQPENDAERQEQDEARQIAEDRAALQRYEYEFDQFLSKAYEDDSAVIVDDAESETTSTSDRGLFARRMAPSTPSAGTTSYTGSVTQDEDFFDEAHTDDEFQDPCIAESAQIPKKTAFSSAQDEHLNSGDTPGESSEQIIHERMVRYEKEAADYLDGTNVSDEEDARFDAQVAAMEQNWESNTEQSETYHADNEDEDVFGADQEVDEEKQLTSRDLGHQDHETSSSDFDVPSYKFPDRQNPLPLDSDDINSEPVSAPKQPNIDEGNVRVDVMLEGKAGKSQQWSEVSLDRTFYRQLPRGTTIRLRPSNPSQSFENKRRGLAMNINSGMVSMRDYQRVERERDTALLTLEDIVNERSMLAAQVGEMKTMINSAGGDGKARDFWGEEGDALEENDIDLAAEIRDAYETMAKLTEEMETTLSVLDARYRETLSRAHKAEEKCIRLETNASMLESEFAAQGARLSKAITEERILSSLLKRKEHELETLRTKSEKDLQKIDEVFREESDSRMQRIRELSNEVNFLQEKLKAATSKNDRRLSSSSAARRLELEVSGLRRKLASSELKISDERLNARKKMEIELKRMQMQHDDEVRRLGEDINRLESNTEQFEEMKQVVSEVKSERDRYQMNVDNVQDRLMDMTKDLKEARREQIGAEAEAKHVRMRYEESLKKRLFELDTGSELAGLQRAIQGIKDEALSREGNLKSQLEEFRRRAEQAEHSAASAEKDAKEAADVAKLAQERGIQAIEAERKMRQAAEVQKTAIEIENKAWEKLAQQQKESSASDVEVVKSSSRRRLRRSPSRGRDSSSKKDKGGRSDESVRRRSHHRPRLFG